MGEEKKKLEHVPEQEVSEEKAQTSLSETWAQDALEDLDDFIESQGTYIRQ